MLNIKWRGKFESEEELIQERSFPGGAIMFREGDTIQDAFKTGFLLMLPIMLIVIGLSLYRIRQLVNTEMKLEINIETVVVFLLALLVYQGLVFLHELIHALFYPKQEEKTIWSYKKQGAYFIYCDAVISKRRFIVLSIAPMIILGVIPFCVWFSVAYYIAMPYNMAMLIVSWMMIFMSMGDLANIFHAVTQVPKNRKIFNYGLHSYWIK